MQKKTLASVLAALTISFSCLLFFVWNTNRQKSPDFIHDNEVRVAAKYGFNKEVALSAEHQKKALQAKPNDSMAKFMLATDLLKMGQTNEAIALLQQVVAANDVLSSSAKNLIEDVKKRGNVVSIPEKIKVYQSALLANPNDGKTRYEMAGLLSSIGRKQEAKKEFNLVVAQRGPFAQAAKNAIAAMEQE